MVGARTIKLHKFHPVGVVDGPVAHPQRHRVGPERGAGNPDHWVVLVLSIDWFIGMARALGNLIGNCVATVVIGASEKDVNVALARQVLAGNVKVDLASDAETAAVPAE